ncbi:hypothetical protein KQ767_16620, partial [Listeria monocytogenes]|nr:hypothetical protein [Listeria monocytogenes]
HQAVQAFRPHPCQQLSGRIVRSPAPVEWQVVHLHALAAQALGEEFSATFAAPALVTSASPQIPGTRPPEASLATSVTAIFSSM